ncbi:3TM-type holin [Novispirillum sp. DQ9]|uniref:3TM-type holin n=1 Tax=Novispirillum sp. DQ9 TaxID=3398612 RepID=UPI003C7C883F
MTPLSTAITGVAGPLLSLIDGLFTSDEERAEARRKLLDQAGQQRLAEAAQQMSAILAEAGSADPWTSRARPTFLYLMYAMILAAVPMGALSAVDADLARAVAEGMRAWLAAIPEPMWWLFGAGYTGYTAGRSFDKWRQLGR